MNAIVDTLTVVGVFLVGIVARLGIVLAIGLAILSPVLLFLGARRAFRGASLWMQGYRSAGKLRFRDGLRYAPGHTWMKAEGASFRVGIDDLAQSILPWTVSAELPAVGREVKEGEPVATLSCGEHQVRIAAPATGRIVSVNAAVLREPTLAKSACYGAGWLFAIAPADVAHEALPVGEAARSWLRAEGERLGHFLEAQLGMAAADGGELVGDPGAHLDDKQWKALAKSFLRT